LSDLPLWDALRNWWNTLLDHSGRHEPAGDDEVTDIDIGNTGVLLSAHQARHLAAGADTFTHGAAEHTDETRELFVRCSASPYSTGTAREHGRYAVIQLADAAIQFIFFTLKVPDDFVSFTSLELVWLSPLNAGNMYWRMETDYAAVGEAYNTHNESSGYGVTASGVINRIVVQEPATPLNFVNLAQGDYVGVSIYRDATDGLDTIDNVVRVLGILLTYIAEQ